MDIAVGRLKLCSMFSAIFLLIPKSGFSIPLANWGCIDSDWGAEVSAGAGMGDSAMLEVFCAATGKAAESPEK